MSYRVAFLIRNEKNEQNETEASRWNQQGLSLQNKDMQICICLFELKRN